MALRPSGHGVRVRLGGCLLSPASLLRGTVTHSTSAPRGAPGLRAQGATRLGAPTPAGRAAPAAPRPPCGGVGAGVSAVGGGGGGSGEGSLPRPLTVTLGPLFPEELLNLGETSFTSGETGDAGNPRSAEQGGNGPGGPARGAARSSASPSRSIPERLFLEPAAVEHRSPPPAPPRASAQGGPRSQRPAPGETRGSEDPWWPTCPSGRGRDDV